MALTHTVAGLRAALVTFDDAVQAESWGSARLAWNAYAATWAGLPKGAMDGVTAEFPDPKTLLENLETIQTAAARSGARGKRILLTRTAHR